MKEMKQIMLNFTNYDLFSVCYLLDYTDNMPGAFWKLREIKKLHKSFSFMGLLTNLTHKFQNTTTDCSQRIPKATSGCSRKLRDETRVSL